MLVFIMLCGRKEENCYLPRLPISYFFFHIYCCCLSCEISLAAIMRLLDITVEKYYYFLIYIIELIYKEIQNDQFRPFLEYFRHMMLLVYFFNGRNGENVQIYIKYIFVNLFIYTNKCFKMLKSSLLEVERWENFYSSNQYSLNS